MDLEEGEEECSAEKRKDEDRAELHRSSELNEWKSSRNKKHEWQRQQEISGEGMLDPRERAGRAVGMGLA